MATAGYLELYTGYECSCLRIRELSTKRIILRKMCDTVGHNFHLLILAKTFGVGDLYFG
jgi:hypothetical protein